MSDLQGMPDSRLNLHGLTEEGHKAWPRAIVEEANGLRNPGGTWLRNPAGRRPGR